MIDAVILTDADLDGFCLDFFPNVKRRFSSGMERTQKVNLLLETEDNLGRIMAKVRERFAPEQSVHLQQPSPRSRSCDAVRGISAAETSCFIHDDDNHQFSPSLVAQMARIKKTIRLLTEEQYRIIEYLKWHRRVAISGCAGSGKTLVAAEKAIRMSRAGIRTLLLCHSPYLADHLRLLVQGAGVNVQDFSRWIFHLIGRAGEDRRHWSNLDEPTEEDILEACSRLANQKTKYGAIIVDEGQDFRDSWWITVESGLESIQNGYLYVFHDDNQAILPHRGRAPVPSAPFCLSRNCRNAGRVFDIVQRFHDTAPARSMELMEQGTANIYRYQDKHEKEAVALAIRAAIQTLSTHQIVVLTTEFTPCTESLLNGLKVEISPPWSWQEAVVKYLSSVVRPTQLQAGGWMRPMKPLRRAIWREYSVPIPTLSAEVTPTSEDIEAVANWASNASQTLHLVDEHPRGSAPRWECIANRLYLSGRATPARILAFFKSQSWAQSLPSPASVSVVASPLQSAGSMSIPLHNVSDFKGLEADGVILFDPSRLARTATTYVGISRARLCLFSVIPA